MRYLNTLHVSGARRRRKALRALSSLAGRDRIELRYGHPTSPRVDAAALAWPLV